VLSMDEASALATNLENEAAGLLAAADKRKQVEKASGELRGLRNDISTIKVKLGMLDKTLMASRSEFESWEKTVDGAYTDLWNEAVGYMVDRLSEIVIEGLKDYHYDKVLFPKLDAVFNEPDAGFKRWLGSNYADAKISFESRKQTYQAVLKLADVPGGVNKYIHELFADKDQNRNEERSNIILIVDLLNYLNLKQKNALGTVEPFAVQALKIRFAATFVMDVGQIYYSWYRINKQETGNDAYIREVGALSAEMKFKMEKADCLEKCLHDAGEECVFKCNTRYTVPPPL
jgi:hypothetical protein